MVPPSTEMAVVRIETAKEFLKYTPKSPVVIALSKCRRVGLKKTTGGSFFISRDGFIELLVISRIGISTHKITTARKASVTILTRNFSFFLNSI
jgi:hypothetical protein